MDTKVTCLILCVFLITAQGAMPKCCVAITQSIPRYLLRRVERYDMQTRYGPCGIDALILHVKGKKYCANPKVKGILAVLKPQRLI